MKIKAIYLPLLTTLLVSAGCTSDLKDPKEPSVPGGNNIIDHISVSMATRGDEDGDGSDPDDDPISDGETVDINDLIPFTLKFDKDSKIFVSQQTTLIPAFQTSDVIYNYNFIEGRDDANWDEGYNFEPDDQDDPLEWYKIGAGEVYNGGYSLYALFFPNSDEINEVTTPTGEIHYKVMADQRDLENLIKSDIMGAYHSTPTLFTRLKFRLFHLMTYVRIRLYVPVYNPENKTGFRDNALQLAELTNVTPEFAVEWSAIRSSDTQGPSIVALEGEDQIYMYQHPLPIGEDGEPTAPIQELEWWKYIPDDYFEQPLGKDELDQVRVYDFSVIMPMQKGVLNDEGNEIQFSATNFLNFYLHSVATGVTQKYYFNQSFSANSTTSDLKLEQGNFQYLELYVPRVGNKIIYVGAQVKPWEHRKSSFPLQGSDVEE